MTADAVQDYLQTQALKLDVDAVRVALAAADAVMRHGHAAVERGVLWGGQPESALADCVADTAENEALLKQIFMALDSVYSRRLPRSAAVYGLLPDSTALVAVSRQGEPLEPLLMADEASADSHLAVRTARSGWLNLAGDTAVWLRNGDLLGAHNRRSGSQMSLPVAAENGRIFGVIQVEYGAVDSFDDDTQAEWVGLALALLPVLQTLFARPETDGEAA